MTGMTSKLRLIRTDPTVPVPWWKEDWWKYVILIFFAFIFGFPFLWTFYSSFKSTSETINNAWALPMAPTLEGYKEVFQNTSFLLYYRNSLILTAVSSPLVTLISALAGYSFARVRF